MRTYLSKRKIKSHIIDHLKQKEVEPHFINELVGHSQGNISLDRYGKGYNPDILYDKEGTIIGKWFNGV
jgi:hypothetical protein